MRSSFAASFGSQPFSSQAITGERSGSFPRRATASSSASSFAVRAVAICESSRYSLLIVSSSMSFSVQALRPNISFKPTPFRLGSIRALALMNRNAVSRHFVVAGIKHPNSDAPAPANRCECVHVHVAELSVVNHARVLSENCYQSFRHIAELVLVKFFYYYLDFLHVIRHFAVDAAIPFVRQCCHCLVILFAPVSTWH